MKTKTSLTLIILITILRTSFAQDFPNLVTNGDFESGNVGFKSDFIYTEDSSFNWGYYTITKNIIQYAGSEFLNPVPNTGKFFAINMNNSGKQKLWYDSITVKPNTTYSFSCILANINAVFQAPGVMNLKINGKQICPSKVLSGGSPAWTPHSIKFKTGTNETKIEISIVDEIWTLMGNDVALDNIVLKEIPEAEYTSNCSEKFSKLMEEKKGVVAHVMKSEPKPQPRKDFNTEEYKYTPENEFKNVKDEPLSTFSIDVDNASYSNVRRFISKGQLPPEDAVRVEEMINYFKYDYPQPSDEVPFSVSPEAAPCPWNKEHLLVQIGIAGKEIDLNQAPSNNLTFLIDVSGSMSEELELVKSSLRLLVNKMRSKDKISIVVYAGAAGLVLPPTQGNRKDDIMDVIDNLEAGGSTAGGQGILLAYKIAKDNFIQNGNNRIILATDGDFNVGVSSEGELVRIIEEKRKEGVYLSVLGFGQGNYKDSKMEMLADKGNGNYYYIDNILEAQKVLIKQMGGTLYTIAKDVKFQVEFNPAYVKEYRLVGYENRKLENKDFDDDTKDAGELGAGHSVTALYEIVPAKSKDSMNSGALRYQEVKIKESASESKEIMFVKIRYKNPNESKSNLISKPISEIKTSLEDCSNNFRFSAAVAAFGQLLRKSKFRGDINFDQILEMAKSAKGKDEEGYRAEFIRIVEMASLVENR